MGMPEPPYTVLAAHRPPFVFVDTNRVGNARFYGLLVDILPTLFTYARLNATFEYKLAPNNAGGALVNGTWSGIIGQLIQKQADIAAFPLSLTAGRDTAVDLTYSYANAGIGILVQYVSQSGEALSFLKPFSWQLWLLVVAAIFGVSFVLWLLARISPLGRFELRRMRRLDDANSDVKEYVIESGNDSALMESAVTQLGQMPLPRSRSWAVRLLAVIYGFFAIIILASYTANLAAFLTVQHLTSPISGLTDLLKVNGTFGATPGGATTSYFDQALDPIASALTPNMRLYNSTDEGTAAVRSRQVTAFLTDTPTLEYYSNQLPCSVTVVGQPFGPSNLCFGLPKNSSLTPLLNQALLVLEGNGVLDEVTRKWTSDLSQCNGVADSTNANRLTISHVAGLFWMLLIFIGVSLLLAYCEWGAERLFERRPDLLDRVDRVRAFARSGSHKRYDFNRKFSVARKSLSRRLSAMRGSRTANGGVATPGSSCDVECAMEPGTPKLQAHSVSDGDDEVAASERPTR